MEKLFVHGTLMDPWIQERYLGRRFDFPVLVRLDNYGSQFSNNPGLSSRKAEPLEGCCIYGALLDVTPEEMRNAEIYRDECYKRIQVKLADGTIAWMFI
jgi:hypothetical protein